jgi:hypothetical protein
MRALILVILYAVFAITPFALQAQKVLVEGMVVYKAILTQPDGSKKEGLYTITVKNKQVRKELKIGDEFSNVQLIDNSDKAYNLRTVNGKDLAIEMTIEDITDKRRKFYDAAIRLSDEHREIAGYDALKASFSYKDGTTATVYYTKDWKPEMPYTFERFHDLEGFPLAFDYKNEQGVVITFEAIALNEDVVETAWFKVPAGYKVITSEEYKHLKSK